MFYKDKKRAMMKEVIRQAGGENATKEDILEVLFPDSGREYGDFYVYWWDNPWDEDKTIWNRLNWLWFAPIFILLIAPVQWLFKGAVGFDHRSKIGEFILKMLGEK